jgi:hypothetical protein
MSADQLVRDTGIFIWEGIITAIIAVVGYILLVDFPEDAHKTKFFLKDDELQLMVDRVDRDRGDAHVTEFNIWKYLAEAKDWKCWCFAINFGLSGLVTYSASYFLPIILRDSLGFGVARSQTLTAPVSKAVQLTKDGMADLEHSAMSSLSS